MRSVVSQRSVVLAALVALAVAFLRANAPVHAQECADALPGGGELAFAGVGTPNHIATVEGDVCRGDTDLWTFSTIGAPITEHIGILVTELEGDVQVTIVHPQGAGEQSWESGDAFRTSVPFVPGDTSYPRTYGVIVAGAGGGRSVYRLEVCRGIDVCVFGESGLAPGAPAPLSPVIEREVTCPFGTLYEPVPISTADDVLPPQPPEDLSPPSGLVSGDALSPPADLSPPVEPPPPGPLSPPIICLPTTGGLPAAGTAASGATPWLRILVLSLAGVAVLAIVGATTRELRREA